MEPIISKLQEGVKYPRFERDATKTINDLVEHITKERGVYSSSIEPNPNEHNIWFNTDTNTLMIYNNHVWKDFSGSGSSSEWNVENALISKNEDGTYEIKNIKDKTFYILYLDTESINSIKISNLSDNIEFYIFMPYAPQSMLFPNSNIITNESIAISDTIDNDFKNISLLLHKIGVVIDFNVIDIKEDTTYKGYLYNTKLDEILIGYVDNGVNHETRLYPLGALTNINQFIVVLPDSFIGAHTEFINGSFATENDVQIIYPPFRYETATSCRSIMCIFKNTNASTQLKVLSSFNNIDGVHNYAENVNFPKVAIFDRFNPDNIDKICTTYYPNWIEDDNIGLIIKDNWYFDIFTQNFQDGMLIVGLSIIIDDFPINKSNEFFTNTDSRYYCNDLIINNSSDDDRIKNLIERIVKADFVFTNYDSYTFNLPCNSLTYTTNYKSKYIGIPYNTKSEFSEMTIVIANKLRDDTEILIDNDLLLDDLGKINIITIPENVGILENLIDTNRNNNITINGTLTVDSIYDDKGLNTETYQYSIDNVNYEYAYERYDTPVIA